MTLMLLELLGVVLVCVGISLALGRWLSGRYGHRLNHSPVIYTAASSDDVSFYLIREASRAIAQDEVLAAVGVRR